MTLTGKVNLAVPHPVTFLNSSFISPRFLPFPRLSAYSFGHEMGFKLYSFPLLVAPSLVPVCPSWPQFFTVLLKRAFLYTECSYLPYLNFDYTYGCVFFSTHLLDKQKCSV